MAWTATRKLRTVIDNVRRILAVEYVVAARAVDLRAPLQPAPGTSVAIELLRREVPGVGPDRHLAPELGRAEGLLVADELTGALRRTGVELT